MPAAFILISEWIPRANPFSVGTLYGCPSAGSTICKKPLLVNQNVICVALSFFTHELSRTLLIIKVNLLTVTGDSDIWIFFVSSGNR